MPPLHLPKEPTWLSWQHPADPGPQCHRRRLGQPTQPVGDSPELHAPGATFVTLTQHGQLRGCIGSLEAWRPLGQDVRENALAAAFRDPRFAR
jgi:AMMECR1 domain-containing protein